MILWDKYFKYLPTNGVNVLLIELNFLFSIKINLKFEYLL
jgi:hypothetical protein